MNNRWLKAALRRAWMGLSVFRPNSQERLEAQSAEAVADRVKADRLAALEASAFDWMARGREANIELGRVFNQIKDMLDHGEWEPYFNEKFVPRGIALRTAQSYMRMASEVDAVSKNANSALFLPATDPQAQAISEATEEAQAAVAMAGGHSLETSKSEPDKKNKTVRKERVRLDGVYWLPLYMTGDQKDATDNLLASENWHSAEREIMDLLQRLHIKHGIVNDPAAPEVQADTHARKQLEIIPEEPGADPYSGAAADGARIGDAPEKESEYGNTSA